MVASSEEEADAVILIAYLLVSFCLSPPARPFTGVSEKPDHKGASVSSSGWAIEPGLPSFEKPQNARNKAHRPLKPRSLPGGHCPGN